MKTKGEQIIIQIHKHVIFPMHELDTVWFSIDLNNVMTLYVSLFLGKAKCLRERVDDVIMSAYRAS